MFFVFCFSLDWGAGRVEIVLTVLSERRLLSCSLLVHFVCFKDKDFLHCPFIGFVCFVYWNNVDRI